MARYLLTSSLGIEVPEEYQAQVRKELLERFSCAPVFLSKDVAEGFYNGFSNEVLWPLFHYFPEEINFNENSWLMYVSANESFASEVLSHCKQADQAIWIHDYQLMLLPKFIRKELNMAKIGFFLHIPFLTSEIYRVLPVRKEIMEGILGSNLIGFHTFDYARHFLSSCGRVLECTVQSDMVFHKIGKSRVTTIPIGIDPNEFLDQIESLATSAVLNSLDKKFENKIVILGVDRLDYIKGIPNKLHAFRRLLEKNPKLIGNVVLFQIAIPSRVNVPEYQRLRSFVNELAGEINGIFGTLYFSDSSQGQLDYLPVQIIHRSVNINELVALYKKSQICAISSIRDGMNLVAYEYISCHRNDGGKLLLSEFAGSAQSLEGCRIINPWNVEDFSNTLNEVIEEIIDDKLSTNEKVFEYVCKNNSATWCEKFLKQLEEIQLLDHDKTIAEDIPLEVRDELANKELVIVIEYVSNLDILKQWVAEIGHKINNVVSISLEFNELEIKQQLKSKGNQHTFLGLEDMDDICDALEIFLLSIDGLRILKSNLGIIIDHTNIQKEFETFEIPELFANVQKLSSSYPISVFCRDGYMILKKDCSESNVISFGVKRLSHRSEYHLNKLLRVSGLFDRRSYEGKLKYFSKEASDPR